ncbi:unnamed protein product [Coffea canephora]|uniref:Uncharacterized protein n=1 Tax=Coffea canephora TaxID=49390 RepID=A0A068VBS0_COFCA|nr:unnamed protein product [Coffea canephora]
MSKWNKLGERSCLLQPFASITEKVLRRFKKTENCPVLKLTILQSASGAALADWHLRTSLRLVLDFLCL